MCVCMCVCVCVSFIILNQKKKVFHTINKEYLLSQIILVQKSFDLKLNQKEKNIKIIIRNWIDRNF